jgi:hypothetical protein
MMNADAEEFRHWRALCDERFEGPGVILPKCRRLMYPAARLAQNARAASASADSGGAGERW